MTEGLQHVLVRNTALAESRRRTVVLGRRPTTPVPSPGPLPRQRLLSSESPSRPSGIGAEPPPSRNLSAGSRLGAYEIVGSIGAGGMGEVYRARDTRLGRDVALKFLPDDLAVDPDRRARFDREARVLAALNHPGIVSIYAVETEDGQPFIAMECVEGRVLTDVIPKGGLPLDRLLAIATQVAGAGAAAHTHGIVHRDLKPANVMVGPQDRVKVLDFGLAKLRGRDAAAAETVAPAQDITGEGSILGTVAYMSPEQAEGRAVDARSDIFSLGVLFYEMAVGERPFKGRHQPVGALGDSEGHPKATPRGQPVLAARIRPCRPTLPGEGPRRALSVHGRLAERPGRLAPCVSRRRAAASGVDPRTSKTAFQTMDGGRWPGPGRLRWSGGRRVEQILAERGAQGTTADVQPPHPARRCC